MKLSFVLATLCAFVVLSSCQNLPGWTMVWHDEFDGNTLNTTKWQAEVDCWGNIAYIFSALISL
jgi:hypothetical protein